MADPSIDLKLPAASERARLAWRQNVADIDDVVATLCAFANDLQNLGGGYVVCGGREGTDIHGFAQLQLTGLTAARMREVESVVLARCRDRVSPPLTPLVAEAPSADPSRRMLIFTIAATRQAHVFRRGADTGAHYVRVGRSTRVARNGILLQLLAAKGVVPPWDMQVAPNAVAADLDLLALRDALQRMGMPTAAAHAERYVDADQALSPFVPPLCVREPLTGELRPHHFALLLFARKPQLAIPGAVAYLSVYPGNDRSSPVAQRHELAGTVLEQAAALAILLAAQCFTVFDKVSLTNPNLQTYPSRAVTEALANALAHRDYASQEPARMTVFADRIEFRSPGGLVAGVNADRFKRGAAAPKWRNRGLAWFFQKLGLAQAEGQGVLTMRATLKANGSPPPKFELSADEVVCTLFMQRRACAILREMRG